MQKHTCGYRRRCCSHSQRRCGAAVLPRPVALASSWGGFRSAPTALLKSKAAHASSATAEAKAHRCNQPRCFSARRASTTGYQRR